MVASIANGVESSSRYPLSGSTRFPTSRRCASDPRNHVPTRRHQEICCATAPTTGAAGAKHERLYVSKHCNNHGSLKRGEEYNILLRRYELSNEPGVVKYQFTNLYETFC